MATGWNTKQLTHAIGEYLVAAKLCRLGLMAVPSAGKRRESQPLIASDSRGAQISVQVNTTRHSNWQFDVRTFMEVALAKDGKTQLPRRAKPEPYPRLACVLVALRDGKIDSTDRFFILSWRQLRDVIVPGYRRYLKEHGHVRPRSPESFHTKVAILDVAAFEQRWELICRRSRIRAQAR